VVHRRRRVRARLVGAGLRRSARTRTRNRTSQARRPVPAGREPSTRAGRLGTPPVGLLLRIADERDRVQCDRCNAAYAPGQDVDGGRIHAFRDHPSSDRCARGQHPFVDRLSAQDRRTSLCERARCDRDGDARERGGARACDEQQAGGEGEVDRNVLADAEGEQDAGGGADICRCAAGGDRDDARCGAEAEHTERRRRRKGEAERAEQQGAANGTRRPAGEEIQTGNECAASAAWRSVRRDVGGDRAQAAAAAKQRQADEPGARHQQRAAPEAESDDDEERPSEAGRARRGRRDRQGQHRDCVHHSERDDRERDRLEPDADPTEPAQRPDLDQVVEAERQHDAARSSCTDRRQAASLVGLLRAREQSMPAARPQDEAREVTDGGEGD